MCTLLTPWRIHTTWCFENGRARRMKPGPGRTWKWPPCSCWGHRTLERWVAQWRLRGSVAPRPKGGGWRCPIDLGVLRQVVAATPDATSAELCATCNRRVARLQRTTPTSFRRAMHREGYVLKKNGRGRVRSTARTSG